MSINWNDYFYYDETSPSFLRWKVDRFSYGNRRRVSKGDIAGGSIGSHGYMQVTLNYKVYLIHRVIFEMISGNPIPEGLTINHKNINRLDNRFENLELLTRAEQARCVGKQENNSSGVTGVNYEKDRKWIAYWRDCLSGKRKSKSFSVKKYGYDNAFLLACDYRKKMIEEQNSKGANYSPLHGM